VFECDRWATRDTAPLLRLDMRVKGWLKRWNTGFVGFSPAWNMDVYMISYLSLLVLRYLHLDKGGGSLHAPLNPVLTANWLLVGPSMMDRCKARSWGWQKDCILISWKFDCFCITSTGKPWLKNRHKCHRRRRGYVCVALRPVIPRWSEYRIVLPLNVSKECGRDTSGLWAPLRRKKWIRITTKIKFN
jgi:hypothetical protein